MSKEIQVILDLLPVALRLSEAVIQAAERLRAEGYAVPELAQYRKDTQALREELQAMQSGHS